METHFSTTHQVLMLPNLASPWFPSVTGGALEWIPESGYSYFLLGLRSLLLQRCTEQLVCQWAHWFCASPLSVMPLLAHPPSRLPPPSCSRPFSCAFLFFCAISSSFHLIFNFYRSKAYCQQWNIKKYPSYHFSGLDWGRRLHLI